MRRGDVLVGHKGRAGRDRNGMTSVRCSCGWASALWASSEGAWSAFETHRQSFRSFRPESEDR